MPDRPSRLVLIGDPVAHSLSPVLQNAALRAAGIPIVYEAQRVPATELHSVLETLGAEGAAGNITIPYKATVYHECFETTSVAQQAAAVNTFWFDEGRLYGDNTDVEGFAASIRHLLGDDPRDANVVLFGAGGAASAVLAAAQGWKRPSVLVFNRDPARALALVQRFPDVARVGRDMRTALTEATLVVNATPIGLENDLQPCDVDELGANAAVMDMVYRRGGTPWVLAARERGLRAEDGLTMLLEQGALSFRRWFGFEPDRNAMLKSLM